MKISVSIAESDLGFLDEQTRAGQYESRSAAVGAAIGLLRASQLTDSYVEAFNEWHASGEDELWEWTAADGLYAVDAR